MDDVEWMRGFIFGVSIGVIWGVGIAIAAAVLAVKLSFRKRELPPGR